tara:strand:- start:4 stop:756 length:753 start_codon:yes stop_codon:yes gene_type:complete
MTVLLIRANRNDLDKTELEARGLESIEDPYLSISSVSNPKGAQRLFGVLSDRSPVWFALTSVNALRYWELQCPPGAIETLFSQGKNIRFAAVGEQSAEALRLKGAAKVHVPALRDGRSLGDLISAYEPSSVVIPQGKLAMKSLQSRLTDSGFELFEETFYSTDPVEKVPRSVELINSAAIAAVVLRSPSAARVFFRYNPKPPESLKIVCGGKTTAEQVEKLGYLEFSVAKDPSSSSVAELILSLREGEPE